MRVAFLVDGFNLYHSLRDTERELRECVKWLDLKALCTSYLPNIDKSARLESIHYFSALATHLEHSDADKVKRHRTYIKCLEDLSIIPVYGRFKKRSITCRKCTSVIPRPEEKETDVAIAVTLLKLVFSDKLDVAVLLTGDTDLLPAIRTVQEMFPNKKTIALMPFKRKNRELADSVWMDFDIKPGKYRAFQLPDPFIHSDGSEIKKPASW